MSQILLVINEKDRLVTIQFTPKMHHSQGKQDSRYKLFHVLMIIVENILIIFVTCSLIDLHMYVPCRIFKYFLE